MDLKVIVTVNQNIDNTSAADKYVALFARAYQALDKEDKTRPEGQKLLKVTYDDGRFHDISEYYAHLADLLSLPDGIEYIMLPLDKNPFVINADTRAISSPKITVLQNDLNAEVVMFTIDRYFDYMDLNNTQIYVQWTLPSGKEGATEVEMRDLTIPGKIRFGWPLDDEITSEPGQVKYSVRFWKKADEIDKQQGITQDIVVYSLNTLTSSLTISPSLQAHLNDGPDVNAPHSDNFFKKAIINSQIIAGNITPAATPHFGEPGLNLNAYESLVDNTLTLNAQAIAGDTGALTYEWYYKPAENGVGDLADFKANTWYPYNDIKDDKNKVTTKGFKAYGGSAADVYVPVDESIYTKGYFVAGEQYYYYDADVKKHLAYTEPTPPASAAEKTLFERFTSYTVPSGETKVTGQYQVRVVNKKNVNTSVEVGSKVCQLVSPDDIQFDAKGNLAETLIIPEKGTTLAVSIKPDANAIAANRTFTWTRRVADANTVDSTFEPVYSTDSKKQPIPSSIKISSPGWYQVQIDSNLNRETKTAKSIMCKATADPKVPTSEYTEAAKQLQTIDGAPIYSANGEHTLEVIASIKDIPAGHSIDLYSDALTYTWSIQTVNDGPFRDLTEKDKGVYYTGSLGGSQLKINNPAGADTRTYRCIVSNTLNGKTVSQTGKQVLAFYVM